MNREISICDIINISSIIQNQEKYKSQAAFRDHRHYYSDFHALVRTIPDITKSAPLFAFNDEKAELALTSRRCNVATLRRRDVEASRRCILLTLYWLSQRRDVETSRRGDVATFQPSLCTAFCCSKIASKSCSFCTNCTCIHTNHQIRYPATKTT